MSRPVLGSTDDLFPPREPPAPDGGFLNAALRAATRREVVPTTSADDATPPPPRFDAVPASAVGGQHPAVRVGDPQPDPDFIRTHVQRLKEGR